MHQDMTIEALGNLQGVLDWVEIFEVTTYVPNRHHSRFFASAILVTDQKWPF